MSNPHTPNASSNPSLTLNVIHNVTPSVNPPTNVLVPLTLALNIPQKPLYVYPSIAFASAWTNCLGTPLVPLKLYNSSLNFPELNCNIFSRKSWSGTSETSVASWYQNSARLDAADQDGANV